MTLRLNTNKTIKTRCEMKTKITFCTIVFLMVAFLLASCSMGKGDRRDRNLEQAVLARLDSIPYVEYVGMSDVKALEDNRLQAVIIYYVTDSAGNRIEHNARVTANDDCSEVFAWEDLDSNVLGETKRMISDKLEEKGIDMDDSLIDALLELKKR